MVGGLIAAGHRWQDIQHYTLRQVFWFQWAANEQSASEFRSAVHAARLGQISSRLDGGDLKNFLRDLNHGSDT